MQKIVTSPKRTCSEQHVSDRIPVQTKTAREVRPGVSDSPQPDLQKRPIRTPRAHDTPTGKDYLAADNQAIEALQQQQPSMFPDSAQSHSNSAAVSRTARSKQRPNQKKNSQPNIALMQRHAQSFRNFYLYLRMKL